jgi:hypothetical protein
LLYDRIRVSLMQEGLIDEYASPFDLHEQSWVI